MQASCLLAFSVIDTLELTSFCSLVIDLYVACALFNLILVICKRCWLVKYSWLESKHYGYFDKFVKFIYGTLVKSCDGY